MINAQYRVMDAASSVLRRDTSCCREGRALFCPNERHFADQGVERKVRRNIALQDCLDGGWTERGEGIDSLDIRVIQFVDPGKVSDTRGFPCDDLVSPCASPSYSLEDCQGAGSGWRLLLANDKTHRLSLNCMAEGAPQTKDLMTGSRRRRRFTGQLMDELVRADQYLDIILMDHDAFKDCANKAFLGIGRDPRPG